MSFKIISFLRKFLKIGIFEDIMEKSDNFKYLTPEYISELEGISKVSAENKLEKAAAAGFMKTKFLYTNIDLDLNLVVDESEIGKTIRFEDLPESIESNEVFISPDFVKKIYVAS